MTLNSSESFKRCSSPTSEHDERPKINACVYDLPSSVLVLEPSAWEPLPVEEGGEGVGEEAWGAWGAWGAWEGVKG
jgi:hypothetical protein